MKIWTKTREIMKIWERMNKENEDVNEDDTKKRQLKKEQ